MPLFKKEQTIEELQEENERREVELSVAQKKAALKKLKDAGMSGSDFGWDWHRIWNWLKTH